MSKGSATKSLPRRPFVICYTIIFLLAQLVFFIITLSSMPIIKDTVDTSKAFNHAFAAYVDEYYLVACISASIIEGLALIIAIYLFAERHWPALITIITMSVNFLVCVLTFIGLYFIDLRNVYFTIQVTFLIPIITIFLSSVFIIDDTADILNGNYEKHMSSITKNVQQRLDTTIVKQRERVQRGTLRAAENPNGELVRVPLQQEEGTLLRANDISQAAANTIPDLKK